MAIYHCSIKIISRGKGKSAVAAAAYRSGEKLVNEYDGAIHDYTRKGGIVHTEIARLEQELKALSPAPEPQTVSSDMKAIYDFLSQKVDVHGARLAPELIDQFVEVVTPFADYSYRWKLNTGCKKSKEERADLMAVSEKPILTFTIDFETAKRYREANKMPHQFRRAAWTDLTVEVYLMLLGSSSVLNAIHLIHEQTNKAHRQN